MTLSCRRIAQFGGKDFPRLSVRKPIGSLWCKSWVGQRRFDLVLSTEFK
jgi:hypothetical protein